MSNFYAGQSIYHTTLRQWAVLVKKIPTPPGASSIWAVQREGADADPSRGYTNQWNEVYFEVDKRPKRVKDSFAASVAAAPPKANPTALDTQVGGGHYKSRGIQPVTYCHANGIGFMEGCVIKYITRYKDKGGKQDLEKAKHFIDLIIAHEYPQDEAGDLKPYIG